MNEEYFEKIYYLSRYVRNEQIKHSREVKSDKFFKSFLSLLGKQHTEAYKIMFYKYVNPSYIVTEKNLEDFQKMRKKIWKNVSKYLLYLIDYDIYILENKLNVYKHSALEAM